MWREYDDRIQQPRKRHFKTANCLLCTAINLYKISKLSVFLVLSFALSNLNTPNLLDFFLQLSLVLRIVQWRAFINKTNAYSDIISISVNGCLMTSAIGECRLDTWCQVIDFAWRYLNMTSVVRSICFSSSSLFYHSARGYEQDDGNTEWR